MATVESAFEKDMQSSARPIWLESFVGIDWTLLHLSPVYYGLGIPKGDGSPVVLVPGFLGSDFYLYELYLWLNRIGYKPYLSNIGWNADCLNTLAHKLSRTIYKAHKETNKKVHLVGHSLGGILSRSSAAQKPDRIASITTLASPFRGVRSHPCVLDMAEKIRRRIFKTRDTTKHPDCYTGFCDCAAVTALQNSIPSTVRHSAIYTKTDGIVDWQACIHDNPETDFEVTGTHIGLAFNHQVYRLIATRLAHKENV